MGYLNLARTVSSDLVTPVGALDNNWDQIDDKFSKLDSKASPVGTGVVSPDTGMEFVSSGTSTPDIGVYTGSAYKTISTLENWGAWTNITLAANYSGITGRVPQLRVSDLGHVQCRGAIQYLTGTSAWLTGYRLINSGQFANATYSPSQPVARNLTATATASTTWSYGQAFVTTAGGFLNIYLIYMGSVLASNNIISIEGLSWYV